MKKIAIFFIMLSFSAWASSFEEIKKNYSWGGASDEDAWDVYVKTLAVKDGLRFIWDTMEDAVYILDPKGKKLCSEPGPEQMFEEEKITEIYIPKDIHQYENDVKVAPYIIHNGEKAILHGDIPAFTAAKPNRFRTIPNFTKLCAVPLTIACENSQAKANKRRPFEAALFY